ncbi:MAG TPA: HAD-IIIC family phosphatase [Verrucomicrobiae bacterium]|nr:HAD-IIIC family phosphatase [Verrucomicrobiae bacterium]
MSYLEQEQQKALRPLGTHAGREGRGHLDAVISRLPESARPAVMEAFGKAPTWAKVRRANAALEGADANLQGPEVVVHLLASFNLEPIEAALRLGLACIPCRPQMQVAPLNTIEQHLLDQCSGVYREHNLATVVLWRIEELLPEALLPYSSGGADAAKERMESLWQRIETACCAYREMGKSPLVVATFPAPQQMSGLMLNSQLVGGALNAVAELNCRLRELAASVTGLHIMDWNWWATREGAAAFDPMMEQMARQPLSLQGALSLGLFVARHVRPFLAPRRKVLVLDADNTLWGGILGEDGLWNVKLGHEFPGRIFLRIQREARELKNQGVLLALVSKSDEAEVRQAFRELPDMVLRWEDFASRRVNFNHKYESLRAMAEELGLGIDSFAVLDDSDHEREQIRMFHPEVLVINQRSDPLHMLQALQSTDAFDAYSLTGEDRARHGEYQLREARSGRGHGANLEEFLHALRLEATVERVEEGNEQRVLQMLSKTNQFNLTTRRHRLEEVKALMEKPGSIGLTLRLADKFGDQGIVGVLLTVPDEGHRLRIDSYLVSCRALGRGVEECLWAELVKQALKDGVQGIVGEYIPTAKNALAEKFYNKLGFVQLEQTPSVTRYLMEPLKPVDPPSWLARKDEQ